MTELPSGTLTFLMTDIEGSTKLLERLGDGPYERVLDAHRSAIRESIRVHGGHEVNTEGDALFAVFRDASSAVSAAVDSQRNLAAQLGEPVRVRIGLHTGEALMSGGDYVGVAVHRTARIRDAGHGGQILLSAATAQVAGDSATLIDLGPHRLKDLGEPERLFQIRAEGIDEAFAPLRTLDAALHTLPPQRTSFVGQERAIEAVRDLLDAHRLVTLTGIGGCGKTRLALQVAAEAVDRHPEGVFFVDLAPVSDPTLVAQAAATGAGIDLGGSGVPAQTLLLEQLRDRRVLLVIDNCEHLLDAAAELIESVLGACPNVIVLATSRELLEVTGEHAWGVPSLDMPQEGRPVSESHAVRLFLDRAVAVRADFALTPENEPAVAEICRRLDGIPLAIELAAARVTHLSPRQIADRLDDRFRLLTGARRRVQRQQTLQAAMDWSYDLLGEHERVLLRRLAVFAGGFPLEAAEGVCADDFLPRTAIVDGLGSLVAKSLVSTEAHRDETWYRLLETVRAYAEEKLAEAGEADHYRTAHRDWYFAFITSPEMGAWDAPLMFAILNRDFDGYEDNIRAALEWTAKEGRPDLIAAAIVPVARASIDPEEADKWVQYVLAADDIHPDDRITALSISSWLGMVRLDPRMDDDAKRVIELAGGTPSRALVNALLQRALFVSSSGQATQNDALGAEAAALANEAIRVAEAGGLPTWHAAALSALGQHFLMWERHNEAAEAFDAARRIRATTPNAALNRRLENASGAGLVLALFLDGERERAAEIAPRVVETDDADIARVASALGEVMALLIRGANDRAREALLSFVEDTGRAAIPLANSEWFIGFAAIAVEEGDLPRAARLLAAARALGGTHSVVQFRSPASYVVYRHYIRIVRSALSAEDAHRYRDEGRAMSTDEAFAYALEGAR